MSSSNRLISIYLLFPCTVMAGQSSSSWLQLHKLNQASQQELQKIQRTHAVQTFPFSSQNRLNHKQRVEQSNLQESQRRRQIIQNQRRRLSLTEWQNRRKASIQQQRFRLEQQNQLNRFRTQQALKTWLR